MWQVLDHLSCISRSDINWPQGSGAGLKGFVKMALEFYEKSFGSGEEIGLRATSDPYGPLYLSHVRVRIMCMASPLRLQVLMWPTGWKMHS